ncbi:helix-turn-helix domain-containing protein [Arthrobacter sp. Cr_A7]|uniref:helix-turn-helix domain-containing protein n=1 Tax=Arthrobacter sp. Cr_A7 TaxID=3031017 RepID=UPI0023DAB30E|nr:helix-turn-helix domain-containing protein [Arthrobacter sp. Cr_A7]MDF2049374.1 helix-turn-helix domain-containing protein [Arthrobacter sp. Cr_A7]
MMPNKDEAIVTLPRDPDAGQLVTPAKRLLASWQRSEEYGVSADEVEPMWAGSAKTDSLFFQCGQEVLTGLYSTLANEPLSLMLTDSAGLLLNRFSGDTSLLRALDKVHLAPGFAFSERDAGTNGMGLALADRIPTLVRAEEHYSASLRTYTCAAVPVFDPVTGLLEGSVNITTWSRSSPQLLLALAESAAGNTSALMLARSQGRKEKAGPKGGVFRIQRGKLEPAAGTVRRMSSAWTSALDHATHALASGQVVAAIGEQGSGRATLLAQAIRQVRPGDRILSAAAPAPGDVEAWLSLWTPELAKPATAVIVENVDLLPAWAAQELHAQALRALSSLPVSPAGSAPTLAWAVTAERLDGIPHPLAGMVDTVVSTPALRERGDDVMHLARYAARQTRLRDINFTSAAEKALMAHDWPENIDELFTVIHAAAVKTETIDISHLPAYLLGRRRLQLTRIESVERDEIVRCLSKPGATVSGAAAELGISRATIYRRMARLGITIPR